MREVALACILSPTLGEVARNCDGLTEVISHDPKPRVFQTSKVYDVVVVLEGAGQVTPGTRDNDTREEAVATALPYEGYM
jgi:hypothetical protein